MYVRNLCLKHVSLAALVHVNLPLVEKTSALHTRCINNNFCNTVSVRQIFWMEFFKFWNLFPVEKNSTSYSSGASLCR
jgi:hypothetical protein